MNLLRRDLHRDRPQRCARHHLDRDENESKPRSAYAGEFAEEEDHTALILPQDAD